MQLIKLDATESTNSYLKELITQIDLIDFTVITTQQQTKGKGQRGSNWVSEKGKNLTISVLKKDLGLNVQDAFLISIATSLAVLDTLKALNIRDVKIKWPNDILSGDLKLCGILIENSLKGDLVNKSILGIGLNVNQKAFSALPNATSLCNLTEHFFDLEAVLKTLIGNLKDRLNANLINQRLAYFEEYHQNLYKKGVVCDFMSPKDILYKGRIVGVSRAGKLIVETNEAGKKEFGIKEIKLVY